MSILDDATYRDDVELKAPPALSESDSAAIEAQGNWPRLIHLSDRLREDLKRYLVNELDDFFLERGPVLENWQRWQTLYWAEPATKEKNFPFKRAANIVVPLSAIAVGAIHYRMMNTLWSVKPFMSMRSRSKEWNSFVKPTQEFLQAKMETDLNGYEFTNITSLEMIKMGTGVGKSGYEKLQKKSLRKSGDVEEEFFVQVKNGATLERVPLNNFMMRLSETDPELAPWCGERHRFTWSKMKALAQVGRFDIEIVNKIKHRWTSIESSADANDGTDANRHLQELNSIELTGTEVFDVDEIWCTFDVDEDGFDEEIVVDFHKESGEFLSIRYNWYNDLHRPYKTGNLIPVEGSWVGIGICKLSEQFQNEVTTIRRQRLDNATLANMSQLIIKKGAGYGPGEPIFPGKMWFVDDPLKDIREFKLSEIYPSSYANEQAAVRDWEKLTGSNETVLGLNQASGTTTATGDLTRLAEGNKGFDYFLKQHKKFYGAFGPDIISNYQTFGTGGLHYFIVGDDGQAVDKILSLPTALVRDGAIFELTVSDSITNRETEQQKWMQLFSVLTGYYDRCIQLSQVVVQFTGDPTPMLQLAQRALLASAEVGKRLMETFGEPDADRFSLVEDGPDGTPGLEGLNLFGGNGGLPILPPGNGGVGAPGQSGNGGGPQNRIQSGVGNNQGSSNRTQ